MKECKNYLNSMIESFSDVSKKKKVTAALLPLLIGILVLIPFICIYINLFMQFLGIKWLINLSLISCGLIMHIAISMLYPIYYISLNELNKDLNYLGKISYKKIFIALITDWIIILFIIIMVILLVIIVNINLF